MEIPERRKPRRGGIGGLPCVLGFVWGVGGCTTTLDPTTLASDRVEPEPEPPSDECSSDEGAAGAAFDSCVELPECATVGVDETHLFCSHALSHDAAAHECRLRGGHLVEVDSEEENLLLAEIAGSTVGGNVWLGGRRSEAFVWAWQTSQVVFWRGEETGIPEEGVFVTWQPGEPNNSSTVSDEPEKCLALTLGDVDWNDRACSLALPFACEID